MNRLLMYFALVFGLSGPFAHSDIAMADSLLSEPSDYSQLDFYLHTVEVDDLVFNNFGHTAIRVHDRSRGSDLVFNWGIFDYRDPISFSFRFFKGILYYELGVYTFSNAMRYYQREQRTVWQDKLNLSDVQKQRLMRRLIWNAEPENIKYSYQYFFDNCSTRPRDYINEAIGGSLKDYYADQMTGETFRDMVWSHYETNPEVAMSLDITMNSRIDRQMSVWEKMFLPKTLRWALLNIPAELNITGGMPLIASSETLMEYLPPKPQTLNGYQILWLILWVPLSYIVYKAVISWRESRQIILQGKALQVLGVISLFYGLYTGLLGLLMPVAWAFSEHQDLHHNANMGVFFPLDLFLCYLGFRWMRTGEPVIFFRPWGRWVRRWAELHLLALLLIILLKLAGLVDQNINRVLLYMGPITALLMGAVIWCGTIEVRDRE